MKNSLRGKKKSAILFLVTGSNKPGKRGKVARNRMNAKQWRKQAVAQKRALSPRLFRQYVRKIVTPRGFALLEQIHAEIAPRIAPEILADIVPPVVRFASRRKNEAADIQTDSRFALCGAEFEHRLGAVDRDEIAGGEERELAPVLPVEPKEKEASE